MSIGLPEILFVLIMWVVPAALVFFCLYWTIRLAIRHERAVCEPMPVMSYCDRVNL